MDNFQKAGLIVVPAIVVIVIVIIGGTWFSAVSNSERCRQWLDEIENWRADLEGRQNSLGGALDLDGTVASYRNQFNLEVDRYNAQCASG